MEDIQPRILTRAPFPRERKVDVFRLEPSYRALIVACVFILDEGVFSVLLGARDFSQGRMLSSLLIILSIPVCLSSMKKLPSLSTPRFWLPIALYAWFIIISFISNVFIFHYSSDNWVLSLYSVMPITCVILFRSIDSNYSDIVLGIIIAAFIVSALVILDKIYPIPQFETFRRMSAFGEFGNAERLTILKDACVLAFLLVVGRLTFGKTGLAGKVLLVIALLVIGYPIAFSFESRIAFSTIVVSFALYFIFARVGGGRKITAGLMVAIVGIPVAVAVLSRFIEAILSAGSLSNYFESNNVDIRFESGSYFISKFLDTSGVGIGVMTSNPAKPNILSEVVVKSYILTDHGLFASLYQFGIVGAIIACLMTVALIKWFIRIGRARIHPSSLDITMTGAFVFGSVMQPIPINYFTLTHTCLLGGTLWYAAFRARWEANVLKKSVAFRARSPSF
ncbi:hypothetical protein [Novosphingobium sp. THN1]|uniref:hypothetical protein n=1 Tax=Novosphingobium sp. THN1 TaxID=1016987 RepID=UPI0013C2F12B|nr:hypothetical protein [Novosphingobium sp. THN1]